MMLSSITPACATVPTASEEDRTLAFGCDDTVVIGKLKNDDYQHVDIEDDILGHGWISAELSVRKSVKGNVPQPVVPVKYFAHTYMREDRDFMLVLSEAEDRTYHINTAQLMSVHPRLASRCE